MKINEIQVSYKNPLVEDTERISVVGSEKAFEVFSSHWQEIELVESFYLLALNRANKPLGIKRLSQGGLNATIIDTRIVFSILLKGLASSFIIAHNHPSCNLAPSEADKAITKRLQAVGDVVDIKMLDHLILSPQGKYYSFADNGLL